MMPLSPSSGSINQPMQCGRSGRQRCVHLAEQLVGADLAYLRPAPGLAIGDKPGRKPVAECLGIGAGAWNDPRVEIRRR
jgi:hypothetical protein